MSWVAWENLRALFSQSTSPKPKNRWPEPERSTGTLIRSMGRSNCWQAEGPARNSFDQVAKEIKKYLERSSDTVPYPVTWSIYMIGRTRETASPTIMFSCNDSCSRQTVRKTVESSQILHKYPGIKTGDCSRPPDFDQLVQLATRNENSDFHTVPPGVYTLSDAAPSPWGICGTQIFVKTPNSPLVRKATAGGIVICQGKCFALTVAHAFAGDGGALTDTIDNCRFEFDIDEPYEFYEDDQHLVDTTSTGSITPSDYGTQTPTSLSESSSQEERSPDSHELEENNLTPPMKSECQTSDVISVNIGWEGLLPFGISSSTPSNLRASLDYTLVEVSMDHISTASTGVTKFMDLGSTNLYPEQKVVTRPRDANVVTVTGSSGVLNGRISGVPSFTTSPNNTQQELWTVQFDGVLAMGDCGSCVIDRESGNIYGHLVAGSTKSGMAHIIPAYQVIEDLRRVLGGQLRLSTGRSLSENPRLSVSETNTRSCYRCPHTLSESDLTRNVRLQKAFERGAESRGQKMTGRYTISLNELAYNLERQDSDSKSDENQHAILDHGPPIAEEFDMISEIDHRFLCKDCQIDIVGDDPPLSTEPSKDKKEFGVRHLNLRKSDLKDTAHDHPMNWLVLFTAASGFFTDSYNLFATNIMLPILAYIYWPGNATDGPELTMNVVTLLGSLIGQLVFGFLADRYGRRKLYGMELVMILYGTVGITMVTAGVDGSLNIMSWVMFWRLIVGIGTGAEYPLSAVITAEFAPARTRARLMAVVFFMQPLGRLFAALAGGVVFLNLKPFDGTGLTETADITTVRRADALWRLVIGIGGIPGLIALSLRLLIPESPRYVSEVVEPRVPDNQRTNSKVSQTEEDKKRARVPGNYFTFNHIKQYFWTEGNWRYLAATSLCWFVLDFTFYGLGINNPRQLTAILDSASSAITTATDWQFQMDPYHRMYQELYTNTLQYIGTISAGSVLGSILLIRYINHVPRKTLLVMTFSVLAVLFASISIFSHTLSGLGYSRPQGHPSVLVLYLLCLLVFNLGPSTLTFIISAEVFPTRYRCTSHGISAASGKLGSILVQLLINRHRLTADPTYQSIVLGMFALMMALGAFLAWAWLPELQHYASKAGPKSVTWPTAVDKSLEDLGKGRKWATGCPPDGEGQTLNLRTKLLAFFQRVVFGKTDDICFYGTSNAEFTVADLDQGGFLR